jgi:hypothetical protein
MGHEINIDLILDLERQIEEGAGDIIKLKRARNSLLNISTIIPPEILGSIFRWNVIPNGGLPPFGALPKGTYNFLLVCRRWFDVASHTPELWSFWGNTSEKWSQWYRRSGTTPVDLVLNQQGSTRGLNIALDGPLRDALRDRATSDTIRSLHLFNDGSLVTSVLSTLTPDDEGIRCSSIESITLYHVDASEFFAHHRFPKLWYLALSTGVKISSWQDLGLRTTALTTLSLKLNSVSHVPTTPQLLSILASNPRLQSITLSRYMVPRDNGDGSMVPVPLRHLKELTLAGDFHLIFRLLRRLDHPETMDKIALGVLRCTAEDILGTFGPYVQDYIQRGGRFRDGLGVHVASYTSHVSVRINAISRLTRPNSMVMFARFEATLQDELPLPAENKLWIDFVAHIPGEHVVCLSGEASVDVVRGVVATMPKIRILHLTGAFLVGRFLQPDPDGPLSNKKLLPSLQWLKLKNTALTEDGWSPIIPYLTHLASGGQRILLTIEGPRQHICKDVLKKIKGLVGDLFLKLTLDDDCPFDRCSGSEEEGWRRFYQEIRESVSVLWG